MYSARGISVDSAFARRIETRFQDSSRRLRFDNYSVNSVKPKSGTQVSILRAKAESRGIPRAEYT